MSYTNGLDKPTDYFNTKLYTGNSTGSTEQSITGLEFSPDMVWIKSRTDAEKHSIADTVRGATKTIHPHLADAEETSAGHMVSFDANGYTVGVDNYSWNKSGSNYASWCWRGSDSSASSNSNGSITSTVSANTTSGFSIVSYTGTGANATVGHGLNSDVSMIIIKNRDDTNNWFVHHKDLGGVSVLALDTTSVSFSPSTSAFQNPPLTSSLIQLATNVSVNNSGQDYIAYCFAEKKGFSKFGSYTGNGSTDGTFVYTGFKPAFVIIKNTGNANNWVLLDNKRNTFNVQNTALAPNTNGADDTNTSNYGTDFLSNGMKMRTSGSYTSNSNNATGDTFIYMAFASEPFTTSTGIPCTAR